MRNETKAIIIDAINALYRNAGNAVDNAEAYLTAIAAQDDHRTDITNIFGADAYDDLCDAAAKIR